MTGYLVGLLVMSGVLFLIAASMLAYEVVQLYSPPLYPPYDLAIALKLKERYRLDWVEVSVVNVKAGITGEFYSR